MKVKSVLFILVLLLPFSMLGQDNKKPGDSVAIGYKKIETYSEKNNFTRFIHKLVFKSTEVKPIKPKNKIQEKKYQSYEGKIVRNINVISLDPFGYSEKDTSVKPKQRSSKIGNGLHFKTKDFAIRNLLLFKKNSVYDSLTIKESERLIRNERYIRRVEITSELVGINSDSIDITVISLDSWSLIPNGSITPSRVTYELNERNFLGFGHKWDNTYRESLNNNNRSYSTRYSIPSILNTFITSSIYYQIDFDNNYYKGIQVDRTFFSPLTKWAGGFLMENVFRRDSLPTIENSYVLQNFNYNKFDIWGGYSVSLSKGTAEKDRTTNFIATLRYLKINYLNNPEAIYDPEAFYSNETFWLTGLGISSRKYIQDEFIFNYGITEDVPIGKYYGITGGYQNKNNAKRSYFGIRATLGDYFKWGYFSTNYEYGTFFKGKKNEQSAFVAQINYFTPLFEPGKWKIRQFFKCDLVFGGHRLESIGDQISINESKGILGFNDPKYLGTKKMVFAFQTQSYSPWSWAGFRFNPFFNYSLAFLGNEEYDFRKSQGYSKIGLGILISNDFLIFSSFQLSFAYYPKTPNNGYDIIKSNTFKTSDFGYLDFEINKPRTVLYE